MSNSDQEEKDLSEELRLLGANLKVVLTSAWESEERKKIQHEIGTGLQNLGNELQKAADEFDAKEVGQEVKAGFEEVSQKFQSGELGSRMHNELLNVLRTINTELQDVRSKWSSAGGDEGSGEGA